MMRRAVYWRGYIGKRKMGWLTIPNPNTYYPKPESDWHDDFYCVVVSDAYKNVFFKVYRKDLNGRLLHPRDIIPEDLPIDIDKSL